MAREQFGICAEPSLHGYYLLFNALDDKNAHIRQALSRLPALFDKAQFITFNAKKWGQIDSS